MTADWIDYYELAQQRRQDEAVWLEQQRLERWRRQRKWAQLRGLAERVRRLREMAARYCENGNHELAAHFVGMAKYAESEFVLEARNMRALGFDPHEIEDQIAEMEG